MKIKPVVVALAALSLSACMQAPDDTDSLRSMSNSSMLMTTKDYSVSRSVSAVNASLRAGAEKCFQRVSSQTIYGGSPYGSYGPSGHFSNKYSYTYENTAQGGRLALHAKMVNKSWNVVNLDKNGGYMFMAETSSGGRGTNVRLYTPRIGMKDLNEKVIGWAAGQHLLCPML